MGAECRINAYLSLLSLLVAVSNDFSNHVHPICMPRVPMIRIYTESMRHAVRIPKQQEQQQKKNSRTDETIDIFGCKCVIYVYAWKCPFITLCSVGFLVSGSQPHAQQTPCKKIYGKKIYIVHVT